MAYVPTLEDTQEFLAENELQQQLNTKELPSENSSGTLNFLKGLAAGGAESLANVAPSIANVALGPIDYFAGTNLKRPYVNLEEFRPKTTGGDIGHITGNIAGVLAPGGIAAKALTKLLGAPGLLKTAAATSAANAGISGGENELYHRGLAGLSGIIPLAQGLRTKSIVNKAVENKIANTKYFGEKYDDILNTADKLIPQGVRVPSTITSEKAIKTIKPLGTDAVATLRSFLNNPSLRSAHEAQSDLGKIIRKFEDKTRGKNPLGSETKAIREAENLRKRIKGVMQDAFVKNKLEPLGKRYQEVTKEYAQKMPQYLDVEELGKYAYNPKGTNASAVLKAMLKEQAAAGNKQHYKEIPGFTSRRIMGEAVTPIKTIKKLAGK